MTELQQHKKPRLDWYGKMFVCVLLPFVILIGVSVAGNMLGGKAVATHVASKNLFPSVAHPFGTDWLGRDMLARTLKGLSTSIIIGVFSSVVSAIVASVLGTAAALFGRKTDTVIDFLINTVMGIPHILLLILISYWLGKGMFGVIVAVSISHWHSLARVIRGETLVLREAAYVKIAAKLGKSRIYIVKKHMIPHLFPQFLTGLVLLFPHAILHEASLTFLGFGLKPEQPGIGTILSESMKYLSLGMWWLAVFPGIALLITVLLFDVVGNSVKMLWEI